MSKYIPTIGIEIHLELLTKTKMFSSTSNNFGSKPNTNINEIDLGYPGAMPSLNKQAVKFAIMLAKALNMEIDRELHFDRKHYFYPDLPKGFQITQQLRPIGKEGFIYLNNGTKIEIERIHLEEDTAKQIHIGKYTYLDFNRCGIPLIEIVTKPVIHSAIEATEYCKLIQTLATDLKISDAKMEEGSLRADVNISIAHEGSKQLGTRVEIKNINSFSNLKKAIEWEIAFHEKQLINNCSIQMATKRFNEATQTNIVMRIKNEAIDYKYMKEPNLIPIKLEKDFIDSVKLPILPWERKKLYLEAGLNEKMIEQFMANPELAQYYESFITKDKLELAKVIFSEILPIVKKEKSKISDLKIDKKLLVEAIKKVKKQEITRIHLKQLIPLLDGSKELNELIRLHKMKVITSKEEIEKIVNQLVEENYKSIQESLSNKDKIEKILMGQLMKKTQGQITLEVANIIIKDYLSKI